MSEIKTKVHDGSVTDFLNAVPDEQKRKDAYVLLELFKKVTKCEPKLWGPTMVGFGAYHYKSERSRQEGDWLLTGFSPRKQNLTLYVMSGIEQEDELLQQLGKHTRSVGCLYIKKLADVDLSVLEKIIKKSFTTMKEKYGSI